MPKTLSSAQQLRKLKNAAKSRYKVAVDDDRFVVAMNRDLVVSGVPIKTRSKNPFDNIALISVEPGFKVREKLAVPAGVYKLTKTSRTSRKTSLEDDDGRPVVTGNVHAAPLRIPIGDIVITIGGGRVCVYWDDPIGTPGGVCHCHCIVLTKKKAAA
jgi:hypothetical protein